MRHPSGSHERIRDGFAGARDVVAHARACADRACRRLRAPRGAVRSRVRKTRCVRFATSSTTRRIAMLRRHPSTSSRASRRRRRDPPRPTRPGIFFAGVVDRRKNRD
jgi:hypothetical protein